MKLQAAMNESPGCDCLLGAMLMLLLTCVITFWEVIMSLTQCYCFHWRHKSKLGEETSSSIHMCSVKQETLMRVSL